MRWTERQDDQPRWYEWNAVLTAGLSIGVLVSIFATWTIGAGGWR